MSMWHSCLKRAFLTSWKCNRSWWRINHYTGADCAAPAVDYWQKAGQRAIERSANQEAISHLSKGLEFLGIVPETPVRLQQELDLQVAFGSVLMVTKGFGAPRCGTSLRPSPGVVSAGGRHCAAVSGTAGVKPVLSTARAASNSAPARGGAALSGPIPVRTSTPPTCPLSAGDDLSLPR